MSKLDLIGRRLLHLIPVLIGISIISFLLVHLSPGDPIRLLLGNRATETTIAAVREHYGLDLPLFEQYFVYIRNLLHGDLGNSLRYELPVSQLLWTFMPRTLFLAVYVLCISIPLALGLAVLAARKQGRLVDHVIRFLSVCGMTIPVFWLAIILLRVFSVNLGWFPVSGYGQTFAEHLHHLFLPAVSTSAWLVPLLLRNLRAEILQQLEADYTVASQSKGLPERYIFTRHVLKNSILPTLNLLGVMVVFLIAGSVVVEVVFAIPGLGLLMVQSILARDYYVVQGITLFFALFTVLVTLAIDILSALIDPRVMQ